MGRGLFITVEGGEGAGKTTQIAFIRRWLQQAGRDVLVTREPGGTDLGERIRHLLLHAREIEIDADSELLLIFAARAEHLGKLIRPALGRGTTVLCDRFTDATYAYQGAGRGIARERIASMESWVQGSLRPDLTILLDLPVEIGLERAGKRGLLDRFEQEDRAFFERVRQCYRELAAREPVRVRVIDAARTAAHVQHDISTILDEVIRGR